MTGICGIYRITHKESGKTYVGQSRNIQDRWKRHVKSKDKKTLISNAIQKYGPEAFVWEVVIICQPEELDDLESYFISKFGLDSLFPRGYNLCLGGQRVDFTKEVRKRHRTAVQKLASDPSWRRKQQEASARMANDPGWRRAVSEGKRNSERTKRHMALLHQSDSVQKRRREAIKRSAQRPERKEQLMSLLQKHRDNPDRKASVARANRQRLIDPRIWVLVEINTGIKHEGTQYDLRQRLGLSQSQISGLVRGERKTTNGYKLQH